MEASDVTENDINYVPFEGKTVDKVFTMVIHNNLLLSDRKIYGDPVEAFSEYVRNNSLECSKKCMMLEHGGNVVLYYLFLGLGYAIQDGKQIEWKDGLLQLVEKIVKPTHGDYIPYARYGSYDCVNEVYHLMEKGLGRDSIDFKLKNRVWIIIKKLVEIGSPREAHDNYPQDMDSLTVSINDIGGLSFHILSRYALWCEEHEGKKLLAPEIKEIFDGYMRDPSTYTVSRHAILGLFFTNFYHLYEDWARNILENIVTSDDITSVAFWDAHVRYNKLYGFTFGVLLPLYDKFLNQLPLDNKALKKIHHSTIDHVLLAYFYDLPGAYELFEDFLDKADNDSDEYDDSIKHCVFSVGMIIRGKEDNSGFYKNRLTKLWNRSCIIRHDLTRWFEDSPLDKEKTIFLYLGYLRGYDKLFHLFSRQINVLGTYVDDYPSQVADCLDVIVKKSESIHAHDKIKDILERLSNHDDDYIHEKCLCIIGTITQLDYRHSNFYSDLLQRLES